MPERHRPGDRRPQQPDIFARLEQAVGAIQDSETFRAYLDVQARFHRYSPNNVALILSQDPHATRVAGYNDWLRMHRYVKRGERAIRIIVPFTKKIANAEGQEERHVYFGAGNVFDIAQTDGEPLPTVDVPVLQEAEGAELYALLTGVAQREGLRVEDGEPEALREHQMGYYDRARQLIVVRPAAQLQRTKTLAHELAHHFGKDERSDPESETSAESVAYVVLAHYGLDSGQRSFPYIATWSEDKKILQAAMGKIQKVAATIIDGVEAQLVDPMAGGAPMKVYRGFSEDQGSAMGPETVFVREDEGQPYRLANDQRHSSEFSWGYEGSGPAQLARAILTDHLGYVPPPGIYQQFKRRYVARWDQGKPWSIAAEEIERFLADEKVQADLAEHRQWQELEAQERRLADHGFDQLP